MIIHIINTSYTSKRYCLKSTLTMNLTDDPFQLTPADMERKYLKTKDLPVFEAPTIDMKLLISEKREVDRLYESLVNAGFLYVKNHGVSKNLIRKVRKISTDFYHTPHDERKNLENYEGLLVHDGSAFSLDVFENS